MKYPSQHLQDKFLELREMRVTLGLELAAARKRYESARAEELKAQAELIDSVRTEAAK